MAQAGLTTTVVAALIVLGYTSLGAAPAHAEENCLAAPNAPAPSGSHWYYRTDRQKQTKCWHLGVIGEPAQVSNISPTPQTSAAVPLPPLAPERTASQAAQTADSPPPRPTAPDESAGAPTQLKNQNSEQTGRQAQAVSPSPALADPQPSTARTTPWPDPSSSIGAGTTVWPDPPPIAAQPNVAASTAAASDPAREVPDTTQNSGSTNQAAAKASAKPGHGKIAARDLIALAVGLALAVVAGLLVRWLVGMFVHLIAALFARRRVRRLERQEPTWDAAVAREYSAPRLAAAQPGRKPRSVGNGYMHDDDVRNALRKLLQVLDQEAA